MSIVVQAGWDGPSVVVEDRAVIGRAEECTIRVADEFVSPLHAVLHRGPLGWCVQDAGSTNGTWVNGVKIYSMQPLGKGDKIKVGHTVLTVVPMEEVGIG